MPISPLDLKHIIASRSGEHIDLAYKGHKGFITHKDAEDWDTDLHTIWKEISRAQPGRASHDALPPNISGRDWVKGESFHAARRMMGIGPSLLEDAAGMQIGSVYVSKHSDMEFYFKPTGRLKNGKLSGEQVTVYFDRPRAKLRSKKTAYRSNEPFKLVSDVPEKVAAAFVEHVGLDEAKRHTTTKDLRSKAGFEIPKGTEVELEFKPDHQYVRLVHGENAVMLPIMRAHQYVTGVNKPPSMRQLEKWSDEGMAKSVTGARVEPDGTGPDSSPSWLLVYGVV
jgi:hypothetical protein